MKKIVFILGISAFFAVATAATKTPFTCEQIKNKATRTVCIEDRTEKEKAAEAEKVKAIAAEKEKAAEAEKVKAAEEEKASAQERANELENFVRKSKEALTKYYKDPSSAQFTNLVVSESSLLSARTLCGSVNGKNSYGGYVGFHRFYVQWHSSRASEPEIWNEGENSAKNRNSTYAPLRENAAKIDAVEFEIAKSNCEASQFNVVTKIEK